MLPGCCLGLLPVLPQWWTVEGCRHLAARCCWAHPLREYASKSPVLPLQALFTQSIASPAKQPRVVILVADQVTATPDKRLCMSRRPTCS